MLTRLLLLLLAAALAAAAGATVPAEEAAEFADDFSGYKAGRCLREGTALGPWTLVFSGYGCAKVEGRGAGRRLHADASPRSKPDRPAALLLTGPRLAAPLRLRARLQTESRVGPGPWKAAWLVWGYADRRHFYYFIPKPNGWELGKRDPAYPGGQRFLASGRSPKTPLGRWAAVDVRQDEDGGLTVLLDGRKVASVRDRERPYPAGRVGLYVEGAHAHFADVLAGRPGRAMKR
jgi:hypothetical protein